MTKGNGLALLLGLCLMVLEVGGMVLVRDAARGREATRAVEEPAAPSVMATEVAEVDEIDGAGQKPGVSDAGEGGSPLRNVVLFPLI